MVDQFLLQALFLFILKAVAFTIFLIIFSHDIWDFFSKIATAIGFLIYILFEETCK